MGSAIESWVKIGYALNNLYNESLWYNFYPSATNLTKKQEARLILLRLLEVAPKRVRLAFQTFVMEGEYKEDED